MGNIKDLGTLDTSALDAEMLAAKRKKSGGGADWKKMRDAVVYQKDIPRGITRFRLLPPTDGVGMPWVRREEHEVWNSKETGIKTEWSVVRFNCLHDMAGGALCPGETYLGRLERSGLPGIARTVKDGKSKTHFSANVIFTQWAGGAVPEERRGVRVFDFGRGIWKGTDMNVTGGLLALLNEQKNALFDTEDGCEIQIEKSGQELETAYVITLIESLQEIEVAGKKKMVLLPVTGPLGTPDQIGKLLEARVDLRMFTRLQTPDEIEALIAKVNPMGPGSGVIDTGRPALPAPTFSARKGPPQAPARDFRRAQEELGTPGQDDDQEIPF
jgi:hypothetical protein